MSLECLLQMLSVPASSTAEIVPVVSSTCRCHSTCYILQHLKIKLHVLVVVFVDVKRVILFNETQWRIGRNIIDHLRRKSNHQSSTIVVHLSHAFQSILILYVIRNYLPMTQGCSAGATMSTYPHIINLIVIA